MDREGFPFGHVGLLWLLPAAGLLGLVVLFPLAQVVWVSFTNRTTFTPGTLVWLENYGRVLGSPLFHRALLNTVILLLSVPITIGAALLATAILYKGIAGARLYEIAIFIPFLPAVAAISVVFVFMLSLDGPVNAALSPVGLARPWLTDDAYAIWSILAIVSWKRVGFLLLLFQARMVSVDRQYFEAAALDGASWTKTFWYIAIPQMRSVIQLGAMLGFIEVLSFTFGFVFVLTQGGPHNATYTLEFLLYRTQFSQQLVGQASAIAVLLLVVTLVVAVLGFTRRDTPAQHET